MVHVRQFEHGAIQLGLVHSRKGKYVSDETVRRRQKQNHRNRSILEHCIATNEQGQAFTVQELADLSVSNPKIRRAELMTRIAGFDAVALTQRHAGFSIRLRALPACMPGYPQREAKILNMTRPLPAKRNTT